jgi:hypothetical protein
MYLRRPAEQGPEVMPTMICLWRPPEGLAKTRGKYVPVRSAAASLRLTVFANPSGIRLETSRLPADRRNIGN